LYLCSPTDDHTDAKQQHNNNSLNLTPSNADTHDPLSGITGGVPSTNPAGHASQDSPSMGAKVDVAPPVDML